MNASSWPLPRTALSSCLPKPWKWNGSPLMRKRVPSTSTVRMPTASVYASTSASSPQLDVEVVQVALAGPPRMHVRDRQLARRAGRARDLGAAGVAQRDAHLRVALGLDLVGDGPGRAVEAGHDRHVPDVRPRRGVEPDRAVQAGVVEEVVEVALAGTVGRVLDDAGRDRLPAQDVVHDDGDPVLGARPHEVGDVGLERRVAALVLGDLGVVEPHDRAVRGGVEAQHDPLDRPSRRARAPSVWYQASPTWSRSAASG